MHLIASGLVGVEGNSGIGKILFTESTFFAFRSDPTTPPYALLFGAMGGLIYGLMSANRIDKAKKTPRPHLNYPEIAALDASSQKALATCTLICSFSIDDGFTVKPSTLGFAFSTAGNPVVHYKGLIFKKRIIAYLKERGISV